MSSRVSRKFLVVSLVVSVCFIVACGKTQTSASDAESNEGIIKGPSACYMGDSQNLCTELKVIDAAKEGYKNPYTDPSFMQNGNKNQYRMPILAVNMEKTSEDFKIAPNFKLGEFMSLHKASFGIFSPAVVVILQKMRDMISGSIAINSGFRPPKWNANVDGSAKWSRHQYGDGVDIVSNKASLDDLITICRSLGATYIDKYPAHVHCDWRNLELNPEFFGASKKMISKNVEEEKFFIQQDLEDSSQIQVSGELETGNIVLLTSTIKYNEDTEDLYKKWIIIAPNGDQTILEQPEVSLSLRMKGTYQIIHDIGIHVHLRKTLFVR
jgi:hypothetical protein